MNDPLWLSHRYDPGHDSVHFVRVPRQAHRRATFLTDDYLRSEGPPVVVRRSDAMSAARSPATQPHFIFHSAFCCSTLVARALDRVGWSMGLKEPVILNDLVGWRRRGATGSDLGAVLDDALTLLARPFGSGEGVIVKPSNVVNGLAMTMMDLRPRSRALLMYAPLEDFLASVAKKGLDGRLFARELFLGQLKEGLVRLGFDQDQIFKQTDLQIAAAGWLVQMQLFQAMSARYGGRVRLVSSDALLAAPHRSVAALAGLFDLDPDRSIVDAVAEGPAFTTHSKDFGAFNAGLRATDYAAAAALHGDEIGKVVQWARAVADFAEIDLYPKSNLLVET